MLPVAKPTLYFQLQSDWAQVQVIELRNDGAGFGFGISGSRNSGAVVRNIFPGGAADREGQLRNGDHLLQVGDVRLWGMGAQQVRHSFLMSQPHPPLLLI